MLDWNHTLDQSSSYMVSYQNRVKMRDLREISEAVRGSIARRIVNDAACVFVKLMSHAEPCLGMVTGGIHPCDCSRQGHSMNQ
jgi:hypothetical protein